MLTVTPAPQPKGSTLFHDLDDLIARVGDRRIITDTGCWLFDGAHSVKGYPTLYVGPKSHPRRYRNLHRLACAIANGLEYEGEWHALHRCPDGDNPGCWNPAHLRPGTNDDNQRDKQRNGVLLKDVAPQIDQMLKDGVGTSQIARTVGLSPYAISNYKAGRRGPQKVG